MAEAWNGDGKDPWLPARLEALLEVTETERNIRQAFWAELSAWLVETVRRVLSGSGSPDLDAVWARVPAWHEAVERLLRGEILEALQTAFRRILGDDYPWDQRVFTARYLAEVRNRLVRTPDEVYHLIAREVQAGINLGEGVPELRDRVDSVLSTSGSDRWPNRATVVARTEAIAALNAGRMEAFAQIVADEPDTQFETVWLATDDRRTRPTHVEADGQRQPFGQPFVVGGFSLAFPGDPTGPPQEVIQCRCVPVLVEQGEEVLYTDRQFRD